MCVCGGCEAPSVPGAFSVHVCVCDVCVCACACEYVCVCFCVCGVDTCRYCVN